LSLDAIRDVLTWSQTEGATRLVLVVIAYHADRITGESYASHRRLAAEARVSSSTIYLALRELLGLGEVELLVTGVGRRANTYRVRCSASAVESQPTPVVTPPSRHYRPVDNPVDNSVVPRSPERSASMVPPVVPRSWDTPIRKRTEELERIEREAASASSAPTDLPADAVGRRSASKAGVPPAASAALQELKNGWRQQNVAAQQAERERLERLFGPAQTEPAPAGPPDPKETP
jgi:hypothetical protein